MYEEGITTLKTSNLVVAKIVTTPTLNAWSQAYNAGSLLAVLSLKREYPEDGADEKRDSLHLLGKELFDELEQEYFTLETKNLASIKQAISTVLNKLSPQNLDTLLIASITNNLAYLFAAGQGKILLKRGETLATILSSSQQLASASGSLENNDILIMETQSFTDIIPNSTLLSSFDHIPIQELAETLTPKIHEKEDASACSLFAQYKMPDGTGAKDDNLVSPATGEAEIPKTNPLKSLKNRLSSLPLTHSKKILLTIAVIITSVLIASIHFANQKKQETLLNSLFQKVYPPAKQKYNEGESLKSLNKNLARDDFLSAQKMLSQAQSRFAKGSTYYKEISDLLGKTDKELTRVSDINSVSASPVGPDSSLFLETEQKNGNALFLTQDDKNIYLLTATGVDKINKSTQKRQTIIKNNNLWTNPGGLGVFYSNIYVLDKNKNQILKFVPSGSGFSKSNYLARGVNADFANASDMTIDSSIYVLSSSGTIEKFLRGQPASFKISGLGKPFSNPSRIFADRNTNNVYVLDNGNSRIVVLDKNGAYQAQYKADILKKARDFEVLEKDKKIYILSGGKVYEIGLK
ncbi:hypothetical protein M1615_00465 [Patescibacteria group bacterium]|nr:hypothetical protein [Patescibacteria group bacterium]MCL5010238.1 hypothetical protein [Patescibacteria group bacterium]